MSIERRSSTIAICAACGYQYEPNVRTCPRDGVVLTQVRTQPFAGTPAGERYEVLSVLGLGGMSIVYTARHKASERLIAVKMLRPDMVDDKVSMQRFRREATAVSQLNHPNIIKIYDFDLLPDGQPFLVMDFIEGESLESVLARERRLSAARTVPIAMQISAALGHAHDLGVLHRDVKPSNIFLTTAGGRADFVKILDFGASIFLDHFGQASPKLTLPGKVMGTPFYLSPEQCRGDDADERSEVYSLGCVLYEMLTGRPPFVGATLFDTLCKHTDQKAFPLTTYVADVPPPLEAVVLKALEKSPDQRYQSMHEFGRALEALAAL